ncbi:YesL family protein [Ectobacillus funiculus]|uniref:YesL family protein n=1 Tax=Ectobacillus funiculus TaxID=137993 RepID=UPI00101DFE66|nr:YesL family protein [Ectobacillus funiculus]
MFGKSVGKLFTVCEWIMKLAYVNILWFLFTAAGLVMFGFMPATVALFTIVRKWLLKEIDIPIWRTFLTVYKNEFRKSNILGFILAVCGTLIYIDFQFLLSTEGITQLVMSIFLLIIACFYLILLSFFFPVYVHYDLKVFDYLKYAVLLGALNFHMVLFMLAGLSAAVFLLLYVPGLIPFFSAVSISCVLMSGGVYSFKRVQKLQMKARVAG